MKRDLDIVLVDALDGLEINVPEKAIVKGDALSYSIGAASIVAKVTRDRFMVELDKTYPEYGFAKHKGYGTKMLKMALEKCRELNLKKVLISVQE